MTSSNCADREFSLDTTTNWRTSLTRVIPISKEESACLRVFKEPVREEERVEVVDLRIASAPIVARKHLINRANRVMSRNAPNAGDPCEESEPTRELSRLFA